VAHVPSPARAETAARLNGYLAHYAAAYPGLWQVAEKLRSQRGKQLPQWESWCYLPMAGATAIVTQGRDWQHFPLSDMVRLSRDISIVSALCAWRATQGIYRFQPNLYQAVRDTPLHGQLPTSLLYRLPEWCVYIETPGEGQPPNHILGFFAFLEDDMNHPGHHELRFVLDYGTLLLPYGLHLDAATLPDAVASFLSEAARNAATLLPPEMCRAFSPDENLTAFMARLVSLVLYLCADDRELRDGSGSNRQPGRPKPVRTKKGPKLFPPDRPTTWEVGYRIGAALQKAAATRSRAQETASQTGRSSPIPHIRRAHWHSYWVGKRSAEERRLALKWLAPILVGAKEEGETLVPTFHDVKPTPSEENRG